MKIFRIAADSAVYRKHLVDYRTGSRLFLFNGSDFTVEVACFNNGVIVTDLETIQVQLIKPGPPASVLETQSAVALEASLDTWKTGELYHASFDFSAAGNEVAAGLYTLAIQGNRLGGESLIYGAGFITIIDDAI